MTVDTESALPVRPPSTAADDDDNGDHSSAAEAATRIHVSSFSMETVENDPEDGVKVEDRAEATEGETETAAPTTTTDAPNDGPADGPADADEPPPPKRRSLCDICHSAPAKYKCPRCPQAYCSVTCSRTHKDNHPPDATPDPTTKTTIAPPPPATSQPASAKNCHPFRVLDDAPELQRLFQQYPGLPARLRAIHDATLPPPPAGAPTGADGGRGGWRGRGRGGGGFRGRGGRGRDVSFQNNNKPPQPWTREHGLRQGQRALRQARVDPGDDGDGVRAYCELVLHLLARDKAQAEAEEAATTAADEATALVRQEVARADAELVEQLLQAEKAAGGLR